MYRRRQKTNEPVSGSPAAWTLLLLLLIAGCGGGPALDEAHWDEPAIAVILLDENGALLDERNAALASGHAFLAGDFLRVATAIEGIERGEVDPSGAYVCRDTTANGGRRERAVTFQEAFREPCRSVFREIQRKIPWSAFEPRLRALGLGAVTGFGDAGEDPGFVPGKLAGESSWDIWANRLITASPAQMALALHRVFTGEGMSPGTRDLLAALTARDAGLHTISGRFEEEMLGYRWTAIRGPRHGEGPTFLLFAFALTPSGRQDKPDVARYAAEWFGAPGPI